MLDVPLTNQVFQKSDRTDEQPQQQTDHEIDRQYFYATDLSGVLVRHALPRDTDFLIASSSKRRVLSASLSNALSHCDPDHQ